MHVYIQWITKPPSGWKKIHPEDWLLLPKKPKPAEDRVPRFDVTDTRVVGINRDPVDSEPGWINAICVCGHTIDGDRIALKAMPDGGLRVWYEHVGIGCIHCFWPIYEERSVKCMTDGVCKIHTHSNCARQTMSWYVPENQMAEYNAKFVGSAETHTVHPYEEMPWPAEDYIRYGAWALSDEYDALVDKRHVHGYKEWLTDANLPT